MTMPVAPGWTTGHLMMKSPLMFGAVGIASLCIGAGEDTRMVAITFDDAYMTNVTEAKTTLDRYGYVATAYIPDVNIEGEGFMGHTEIASLKLAKWEIGGHSVNHLLMTQISKEESAREVSVNKETLGNYEPTSFATPYGDFNDSVIDDVVNAGYGIHANAWSEMKGVNTRYNIDPLNVHREDITTELTVEYVCNKIESLGDYTMYAMMFHDLGTESTENKWIYDPEKFDAIVKCIHDAGVEVVTITDGTRKLESMKNENS